MIQSDFQYNTTQVDFDSVASKPKFIPKTQTFSVKTEIKPKKTGLLLVGFGGNNGSTLFASLYAHKENISWRTKEGIQEPNYYGSLLQAGTLKVGMDFEGKEVFLPFKDFVPILNPSDLVIGGWDINDMNMADAMVRAKVLDYDLQRQVYPHLKDVKPLPSIYVPDYIASNQKERANHVLQGTKKEMMEVIRRNIQDFKEENQLEQVIVLWTASTERFTNLDEEIHYSWSNLEEAIQRNETEISPSTLFAVASILEGVPFINGSPQNTLLPAVIELAQERKVFIAGNDFKTGQTKMKSVLVDYLVGAGIKLMSLGSTNFLGNSDSLNLSEQKQFKSKEISKAGVIDDIINSNKILYKEGEKPDHCIVIKHMQYLGDSKRALDEYVSEIYMNGRSNISIYNICEDSLLAVPVMLDLVVLMELLCRVKISSKDNSETKEENVLQYLLSYFLKAPELGEKIPLVNSLFRQRSAIENFFRMINGLQPENNLFL